MTCSKDHREEPIVSRAPISLEDLSTRTGEPVATLNAWHEHGLIGKKDEDHFHVHDVGRTRLIHQLLHFGHSLEAVRDAINKPNSVLGHFLDEMARQLSHPMFSIAEAVEITGMDLTTMKTIVDATGIADHDMLDEDDLACLRSIKVALDANYPLEGLVQILRVYADAMRRAAEVGQRTSHFYMHQPAQRELPDSEVMDRLNQTFSQIEPMIEPALLYYYRKGNLQSAWDDMLMHLEEESGLAEKPEIPGQIRRAIMFADLASFTPLAEAMGDVKAAEIVARFAEIVRVANTRCHGRIVKQIGDAFMVVFPECYSALSCALELEQRASAEEQFPAVRVGLHYGPVLYREGDYIGSNVNIASRLTEMANRHQVLVSAEVRSRARDLAGVEWIRIGKQRLKGLAAEVELYEARPALVEPSGKAVDPVCGMEVGQREVAARLSLSGVDYSFCSDDCLRQFVRAPEKYTTPVPAE